MAAAVAGPLTAVLTADGWQEREDGLRRALDAVLAAQRATGLPGPAAATVPFHDRPFRTVDPAVPVALRASIRDPAVLALPADIGAAEQWIDHVPLRTDARRRAAVARAAG